MFHRSPYLVPFLSCKSGTRRFQRSPRNTRLGAKRPISTRLARSVAPSSSATAIHQDWGEVQGNFHEARFFTGLRPSEEIALKERDFDEVRGTLSVTKARVYGVDKDTTKTHEDRVIHLCPRAIAVLSRQRALLHHLKSRGRIDHDQLFFRRDGTPIRDLGYLAKCWRKSSERLGLRFRRPYCARHTSVSWHLMIGKNPLFVSRQHGHSVTTMWRTYASWMEGALETDIVLIQAAMNRDALAIEQVSNTQIELTLNAPAVTGLGTRLATRCAAPEAQVPDKKGQKEWRRGWDYSALRASPFGSPYGRYPRFVPRRSADPGRYASS
jgi:hypothetical protein